MIVPPPPCGAVRSEGRRPLGLALGAVALVAAVVVGLVRPGPRDDGAPPRTQVTGVLHVNVNCSDFERSRAFYEQLGFRVLMDVAPRGTGAVARSVGMDEYVVRGALMVHVDGSTLDLLEWKSPRDASAPYAALNHLGIARIALTTDDLDADVARLKSQGVEFLSEQPGEVPDPVGGTTRFICFKDPDGTVLELVEMGLVMGAAQRAARAARP